jgi:hypothetical protein
MADGLVSGAMFDFQVEKQQQGQVAVIHYAVSVDNIGKVVCLNVHKRPRKVV